ncbi:MAG: hypothetical protein ABI036_07790 [Fibrobacteria bacterium]
MMRLLFVGLLFISCVSSDKDQVTLKGYSGTFKYQETYTSYSKFASSGSGFELVVDSLAVATDMVEKYLVISPESLFVYSYSTTEGCYSILDSGKIEFTDDSTFSRIGGDHDIAIIYHGSPKMLLAGFSDALNYWKSQQARDSVWVFDTEKKKVELLSIDSFGSKVFLSLKSVQHKYGHSDSAVADNLCGA